MNGRRLLGVLGLLIAASAAGAVVTRHDVPDLRHRIAVSAFPALVDLPFEGHGVLIHPRWVLTAAHAVAWQPSVEVVVVGGVPRAVAQVIYHPGYQRLPQELIDDAMASDDSGAVMQFLASSDDIALVRLAEPVADVAPVPLFEGDPVGMEMRVIGRGATGKGLEGHSPHGPNRTDLRHGFNRVDSAEGRWITYRFDAPPDTHPLEAAAGNGDSGGPLLVAVDGVWQVAGITSWKRAEGSIKAFRPGKYGQVNYGIRVAHYRDWIAATIAAEGTAGATR